jgi:hypothetical protein
MTTCEAILAGSGTGTLELNEQEQYLKFSVMKGIISKHPETVRDIRLEDIKNVKRSGNQMEISWKGEKTFLDVFIIKDPESLSRIYESIRKSLDEREKTDKRKVEARQKRDNLAKTLDIMINATNALFDILVCFNGRVNWSHAENLLKTLQEDFDKLRNVSVKDLRPATDDVTEELGSAIEGRSPVEGIKIASMILRKIHEFFKNLTSNKNELPQDLHPNYDDAMQVIEAYYILNDIALGIIVKDEKAKEKIDVFAAMLEDLGKKTNLEIDIDKARGIVGELATSAVNEASIEESRRRFVEQIQALLA